MKIKASELLDELTSYCQRHKEQLRVLDLKSDEELDLRPGPEKWNSLECIEHLNRYGRFYLPEIRKRLEHSSHPNSKTFKSGLLGNYFAQSMLPKAGYKSMNTFKEMNPINSDLSRDCLKEFEDQLDEMMLLLDMARNKNLNRIKTGISISKLIKLKLGDTLRVVIYHNDRHMQQALKIKAGNEPISIAV